MTNATNGIELISEEQASQTCLYDKLAYEELRLLR